MGPQRIALLIEYDGAAYAGSQLQPNAATIQGCLEDAIRQTTATASRVALAGRTDAGVHAAGQVASFLTESTLDPSVLQRALNARLPRDIVVRDARGVGLDFDPRRAALGRHYRYRIDNRPTRPALSRDRAWHVPEPLDVETMAAAAARLTGSHDFAAFAAPAEDGGARTLREVHCFTARERGSYVICDVSANAFLRHQVRRMVGALVQVGRGQLTAAQYGDLLDGPPASAGPSAPPQGLCLVSVRYAPPLFDAGLDSKAGVC